MTVSLIGVVLTADGLSQSLEVAEDRWTMRTRSWAVSGLETRSTQANRIPVNVGHDDDKELGEVLSLHRTSQGVVWALAVCDAGNANRLLGYGGPLYFSPKTWRNRDDGTDITIEHVAVTERPATVCIPPLELYVGGIDEGRQLDAPRPVIRRCPPRPRRAGPRAAPLAATATARSVSAATTPTTTTGRRHPRATS